MIKKIKILSFLFLMVAANAWAASEAPARAGAASEAFKAFNKRLQGILAHEEIMQAFPEAEKIIALVSRNQRLGIATNVHVTFGKNYYKLKDVRFVLET